MEGAPDGDLANQMVPFSHLCTGAQGAQPSNRWHHCNKQHNHDLLVKNLEIATNTNCVGIIENLKNTQVWFENLAWKHQLYDQASREPKQIIGMVEGTMIHDSSSSCLL